MPPQKTKKLQAEDAFGLWTELNTPKYSVSSKFSQDHTLAAPNLSKGTSIEAALERYKKNPRIVLSSWILIDSQTLVNKAGGARKVASLHLGRQQMTLALKVTRRTVTIQRLEHNELQRVKHESVIVDGEEHYVNCSSEEKSLWIKVVGGWNPVTGAVELFHYEEGDLPGFHQMDNQYLEWFVDSKGLPTSPKATK